MVRVVGRNPGLSDVRRPRSAGRPDRYDVAAIGWEGRADAGKTEAAMVDGGWWIAKGVTWETAIYARSCQGQKVRSEDAVFSF
jgi:hypothetical protein